MSSMKTLRACKYTILRHGAIFGYFMYGAPFSPFHQLHISEKTDTALQGGKAQA